MNWYCENLISNEGASATLLKVQRYYGGEEHS